jgi:hypothetical protein
MPTPIPATVTLQPAPLPTPTPPAVDEPVVLTLQETDSHDDALRLDLFLTRPVMEQPQDKAADFQQVVDALVQEQVDSFSAQVKEDLELQAQITELAGVNNLLYVEAAPTNTTHGLVSIKFNISTYIVGAAHPNNFSMVLNYDLVQQKVLKLDGLFLPGSNYLQKLSEESLRIVSETGYMEWPEGAAPDPVNYRNWNITPDGLLITFDAYQVAPYAAGPQQALIPYAALEGLIDSAGPLGRFIQ